MIRWVLVWQVPDTFNDDMRNIGEKLRVNAGSRMFCTELSPHSPDNLNIKICEAVPLLL